MIGCKIWFLKLDLNLERDLMLSLSVGATTLSITTLSILVVVVLGETATLSSGDTQQDGLSCDT